MKFYVVCAFFGIVFSLSGRCPCSKSTKAEEPYYRWKVAEGATYEEKQQDCKKYGLVLVGCVGRLPCNCVQPNFVD